MSEQMFSEASTSETPGSAQVTKLSCHTNIQIIKCQYTWVISNFNYILREKIESPEFSSGPDCGMKWKIHVWPDGCNDRSKGFVSVYLFLASSDKEPQVLVKCSFSILDSTNNPKKYSAFQHKIGTASGFGFQEFIPRASIEDETNRYLVNGKLILQCNIRASSGEIESNQTIFRSSHSNSVKHLRDNLEELFQNGDFSDFTLIVRDREFHVHKALLASRSPVFSAMLKSNMKENRENEAIIDDVEPDVIEEVLRFIYCGKTRALGDLAKDIIPVAEKYNVENLKMLCEESISTKLEVDDAADMLYLADLYNCPHLKENILVFMRGHIEEIKATCGYQNLKKSKAPLLMELYDF